MLINIKELTTAAKARGFRVGTESSRYVELFAPNHEGPDAMYYGDSLYSCCDVVLTDRPCVGYGYNSYFYGPWHDGMCQDNCTSVKKLLALLA